MNQSFFDYYSLSDVIIAEPTSKSVQKFWSFITVLLIV